MRLTKVLPILAVVVLVGVVVLIVVEVANYDGGRAPTEKFAYKRGPILKTCAHFPEEPNGEVERGNAGATVPGRPGSALICRWEAGDKGKIEKAERIVRSKPELAELVRALNSLGVRSDEEWEGEYAGCPEQPIQDYGVGLRYSGPTEVQMVITYNGCGYAWNVQDDTSFLPSERLETTLDRLLESPAREQRREVQEELAERDRALMREVGAIAKRCRRTHEHCELP